MPGIGGQASAMSINETSVSHARMLFLQMLQIWLLAGTRAVINMARNCMGPMIVAMSPELGYTSADKGRILGAFSSGYMLTQILGGILADRAGAKSILMAAIVSVAVCLLVFPFAADFNLTSLVWLLWIAGLMCGPVFPAMQVMTSKWTFGGLKSYASAVCGAGTTAGSLLALGLTSPLAATVGWRMTSVVLACVSVLFGILWISKAQNSPDDATVLSSSQAERVCTHSTWPDLLLSWKRILLSPAVLAIFFVHSSQVSVRTFLVSWMPTYFNEVLQVSGKVAAMYLVVPEILGMLSSLVAGSIARHLEGKGLSILTCRRLFLGFGTMGMGLGLLAIPWAKSPFTATAIMCITQIFSNLHQTGFNANYLDVCKYSNGLVSGVGNSVATFASYLGTILTSSVLAGSFADRQTGWNLVLVMFSGSSFVALLVYMPLVSVTPVDLWTVKGEEHTK